MKDLRKFEIIEAEAEATPTSYRYFDRLFAIGDHVYLQVVRS